MISPFEVDLVADLLPETQPVPLDPRALALLSQSGLAILAQHHADAATTAARRADAFRIVWAAVEPYLDPTDTTLTDAVRRLTEHGESGKNGSAAWRLRLVRKALSLFPDLLGEVS